MEEDGDDFRERVAWQSKYEASTCFGCGSTFNPITNRHHHCRACGRVVCGSCSEHRDKVRGYAKPQRTCDECHERLANELDFGKIIALICPCLKLVKREIRKAQNAQLLVDGAVFVRKANSIASVSNKLAGFFGSSSSGDASRVRVALRSDGLALDLRPLGDADDDASQTVYLHEVRSVEPRGQKGLSLLDGSGAALFEGDLTDPKTRDAWIKALGTAAAQAKARPPPAKTERPASRVATAARRARKELELQSRKRDAETKKAQYLQSVGGGLKYTALAMADRSSSSSSLT